MSNSHSHRGPSIDASYHVLVHLVKLFHSRRFLPMAAISVNGSRRNEQFLQRTSHRCILPNFSSFGKVVSEEKIFQKSTNQKQELSVAAMFVNGSGRNQQWQQRTFHRCFLPSFGSFGQTVSEEKNLKNQPIRNKSPVVAMFVNGSGKNQQSLQRTFHRCFLPTFGSFGQAISEEKFL